MKEKITPWDIQDSDTMKTEKGRRVFLKHVLETYGDDPVFITRCLSEVTRARGIENVAKATGYTRQGLHKALYGKKSKPSFELIMRVAHAFGVEMRVI